MCRRSIQERRLRAPFRRRGCLLRRYTVLAKLSPGYPILEGRLPTCYSPVRLWRIAAPDRLACIRHAASVHPEPGSNSQKVNLVQNNYLVIASRHHHRCRRNRRQCMLYICFAFKDQRDATALPTCGRGLPRISRALVIYASEGETSTVFGKKFLNKEQNRFSNEKHPIKARQFISYFLKNGERKRKN